MRYEVATKEFTPLIDVILLECRLAESSPDEPDFEILGFEFFDDETMIVLYRTGGDGKLIITDKMKVL